MKTVDQLLRQKGYDVWTISPDNTVFEALEMMADKNIGALVVVESKRVVGIFSERDYARKIILKSKSSKDTEIREIMTTKVLCVHPGQTIEECMALMTEKHNRHLPVLDGDRLIGIISIGDVVKSIISEQKFIIDQLENYISWG